MNIALMSHDNKKELMIQFCIAYCGVLARHTLCATNSTGRQVSEATGLPINLFLSHEHGGIQQVGARIAYNEIDMVLFFDDPPATISTRRSATSAACATSTTSPSPPTWPLPRCSSTVCPGAIWTGATSLTPKPRLLRCNFRLKLDFLSCLR